MYNIVIGSLLRMPDTEPSPEDVQETQVGEVTVIHSRQSTETATESAIALSGEEFIATDAGVDLVEAR